jgi:uncharacterized protein
LLHYWFLLPVGIAISTLVMSAGVSGATLWVPVYLLWLKLPPPLAFWLGLLTMLFGFSSGMWRNWRDGSYDATLVRGYAMLAVPAAFAGAWASHYFNESLLVAAFGVILFVYAAIIGAHALGMEGESDRHDWVSWPRALAGGAATGLISIGVGILAMPSVLSHRAIRNPATAIGSLVMINFFTSLAATVGRMHSEFVAVLRHDSREIIAIMIWAAPAVVVGGQIGPRIAQALPSERHARFYFSAVLLVIGAFTLVRAARG